MVAGESQDWSWAASGCVRSLFFVLVSYRSTAALKMDWKLDREEVEGVFETWDIAKRISRQEEDDSDRNFASANINALALSPRVDSPFPELALCCTRGISYLVP